MGNYKQRIEDRERGPVTQSRKIEPIGTIIRKKFPNRKHYEGEVVAYDSKNKLYKIQYKDGDRELFDQEDMGPGRFQ